MSVRSALGCTLRTARISGSSSGDVDAPRPEPNRAMRESTRLVVGRPSLGDTCRCRGVTGVPLEPLRVRAGGAAGSGEAGGAAAGGRSGPPGGAGGGGGPGGAAGRKGGATGPG